MLKMDKITSSPSKAKKNSKTAIAPLKRKITEPSKNSALFD